MAAIESFILPFTPSDPARAGHKKKNLSGKLAYYSFVPVPLQKIHLAYNDTLVSLLGRARASLAELAANYANLSDEKKTKVLEQLAELEADASVQLAAGRPADKEWLKEAIPYAFSRLKKLPLSRRLLCEIHDYTMHDQGNYKMNPGEFRRSQNWLGKKGALLKDAAFVPPNVSDMEQAFSDLEHYIHEETTLDPLLKAALIHYQLEMIHPFLDGNGRAGRLLNQLYLKEAGLLPAPVLPLSPVFLKDSFFYYMHLQSIERSGYYEEWIIFWLNCILSAAALAAQSIAAA